MATIDSLTIEKGPSRLRVVVRIAVWVAVVLAILLLVAYLVVTSSGFIKRFVLPRVSTAIHADITVTDLSLHPFSRITLHGLKIQAKGQEPLLVAPEVRASYSLWSILHGNLRVSEIALVSPTVSFVENPDGTGNLDALLQGHEKKPARSGSPPPAKASNPLQIDVRKVTVSNATFRKIKNYSANRRDFLEMADVTMTLANVKNGRAGTLQLGALIQMDNNPPTGQAGHLQASLNGNFGFTLNADLKPAPVAGQLRVDVPRADGVFGDFSRFSAVLDCDVTPAQIKQLVLRFQRAGEPLGELALSGPLDIEKMEGRLKVELRGIDQRLLNLAGNAGGIDFGSTTISSSNDIELIRAGSVITASGRLDADNVQVTRAGQTTPMLNFSAGYAITVDRAAQSLLLHGFNLAGTQNGSPILTARLSQPMSLSWGKNANGTGESTLNLSINGLNLADWRPFLGDTAGSGSVNLTLKLASLKGGSQFTFDLDSQVQNFSAPIGGNRIPLTITLQTRGQATDFKQFNLAEYRLQIIHQNQSLVLATGSGTYNAADGSLDLPLNLQASLVALGQVLSADSGITSGTAELKARITQKQNTRTITGQFALANLNGQTGQSRFRNFSSTMELDLGQTGDQVRINQLNGQLISNGSGGGHFEISGKCNTAHGSAQLTAKLSDFNQDGLRPFLEPLLGGKRLVSVALNGNAFVDYDPRTSSAIKTSLAVGNLVVNDPQGQFPATPLAASFQMDTTLKKQTADIRQFQITLSPTKRAQNQVQLQGQMDFSEARAIRGNLKLTATALDVTSYYDLFAGNKAGGKPAAAAPPGGPATAETGREPPATVLPFKNFTVAVDVTRLYLHEIEITGWQTTMTLDGGHVLLKPCKLALNGAPVNATVDLNLGVPGYRYDVAFGADRIPIPPLVDTFAPERKGQIGGTCTANAQVRGAGITGASLQKNLTGQIAVGMTNLNLAVANVRSPVLKTVINVVATIPELLLNPQNAIASLMGTVTGNGGGLMDALQKSPIQVINAQIRAGGGRIDLTSASVQSTAFKADAQGSIALAQVLTNSAINIPVTVSVSQAAAKQLNLAPANTATPASAAYVPLPQFLTMRGTIGVPKADINKSALGGLMVKSIGGGLLNTGTNAASNVGHFLNDLLKSVKH